MKRLILVAGLGMLLAGPAAAATHDVYATTAPITEVSETQARPLPALSPNQRIEIQVRCEKAGIGKATIGLISSGLSAAEQAFCQAFAE